MPVIDMPSPCVIDRTPVFDTVTAPVVVFTPIPVPAVIDVTPEFGTFIMRDPSPTNLSAVIDDAVICCDDKKEAKTDPELIFRDEIVAKIKELANEYKTITGKRYSMVGQKTDAVKM